MSEHRSVQFNFSRFLKVSGGFNQCLIMTLKVYTCLFILPIKVW